MKRTLVYILSIVGCLVGYMQETNAIVVIGHRGACGYVAENTLESFQLALSMGVDMIEFDVERCLTGELVIMHDDTIDRTTNGTGIIQQLDFAYVREVRTHNNQQIPTLEETIECINRQCVTNIELKGVRVASQTALLCKYYCEQRGWQINDFLVSSFDHEEIMQFNSIFPEIKTGIIFRSTDVIDFAAIVERATNHNLAMVCIAVSSLTHEIAEHIHALGLQLFVYTINTEDDMRHCMEVGVDGVYSNYPDKMIQYRVEHSA